MREVFINLISNALEQDYCCHSDVAIFEPVSLTEPWCLIFWLLMNAYKFMFLSFSVKDSSDFTVTSQNKKLTNELNRNEHFMIFNLLPFNSKWYRKNIYNSFWNSCDATVVTDSVGLILVHLESELEILKIWENFDRKKKKKKSEQRFLLELRSLFFPCPITPQTNHHDYISATFLRTIFLPANLDRMTSTYEMLWYIWDDLVPFVQFKKR